MSRHYWQRVIYTQSTNGKRISSYSSLQPPRSQSLQLQYCICKGKGPSPPPDLGAGILVEEGGSKIHHLCKAVMEDCSLFPFLSVGGKMLLNPIYCMFFSWIWEALLTIVFLNTWLLESLIYSAAFGNCQDLIHTNSCTQTHDVCHDVAVSFSFSPSHILKQFALAWWKLLELLVVSLNSFSIE